MARPFAPPSVLTRRAAPRTLFLRLRSGLRSERHASSSSSSSSTTLEATSATSSLGVSDGGSSSQTNFQCVMPPSPRSSFFSPSQPLPNATGSGVYLTLMRHGQSRWNARNRFTGWTDVKLTEQGEREAWAAGRLIGETRVRFEKAFTSELTRAKRTTDLVLSAMRATEVPVETTWRLNERHYGGLTGLHKTETMVTLGAERTMAMRRGREAPPPMTEAHPMWKHIAVGRENRFRSGELPSAESLPACRERVWQFWRSTVVPTLGELLRETPPNKPRAPRGVLVVSHLHTIRLLIAELDGLDAAALFALEVLSHKSTSVVQKTDSSKKTPHNLKEPVSQVPTAVPLVYEVDQKMVDFQLSLGAHASQDQFFCAASSPVKQTAATTTTKAGGVDSVVKGKWLGETQLTSMRVDAIRSLLLRRRGLLYELLPHLPEPVQKIFFGDQGKQFKADARDAAQQIAVDSDGFDEKKLRNREQLLAIRNLFKERPWIHVVDEAVCDACARALYAVTDAVDAPPRRKYDGLRTGYHDASSDDDDERPSLSWSATTRETPLRAVAAALNLDMARRPALRHFAGKPLSLDEFPHLARLVAVAAYLKWIQLNGAEFLPEREYRFAKDIAKTGLLSDDEIVADLATHAVHHQDDSPSSTPASLPTTTSNVEVVPSHHYAPPPLTTTHHHVVTSKDDDRVVQRSVSSLF